MLASPATAVRLGSSRSAMSDGNLSDYDPPGLRAPRHQPVPQTQKFPHTRAQLALLAREHRFRSSSDGGGAGSESSDADHNAYEDEPENRIGSELVRQVAALLDEEKEDELKELLKKTFEMDDEATEAPMLELMHAHKDDISGVPFLFLTPTRRPISRPSSRTSNHSFRLAPGPPRADSPSSVASAPSSPSLLGPGPIRRPHTPVMSPLATGHSSSSYMTATAMVQATSSPSTSPTFPHNTAPAFLATSLPASPLSSPRMLNAKAHEFRPTPRPLSAASSNPGTTGGFAGRRTETPSPDLWAHGPGSLRGASRLAIASPLIPDNSLLPPGTPPRAHTPTSPLRISSQVGEEDEEEDPFDPFAPSKMNSAPTFHSISSSTNSTEFESSSSAAEDPAALWGGGAYPHPSLSYPDMFGEFDNVDPLYGPHFDPQQMQAVGNGNGNNLGDGTPEMDSDAAAALTDGMTPFDVLTSVFGSTLAPSELEEALAMNGYDFERAMQWLVDRTRPSPQSGGQRQGQQNLIYAGGGVHIVPRGQAGLLRGGRAGFNPNARGVAGRYGNGTGRPPNQGNNRVCRYFLAGECMRADCRFSHDLDRALCRFWLRGTCAKGETCEFLHHLPNEVDMQGLQNAMSQTSLNDAAKVAQGPPGEPVQDDFPTLGHENARGVRRGFGHYGDRAGNRGYHDPSRTRFAAAVKKVPTQFAGASAAGAGAGGLAAQMANRREAKAALGDSVFSRPTVVAPRPSPRIRLRAPALLPTLSTGESINALYMAYRSRALQLGAARNACLSRAADAWRRGDGAAAKRFSREGHDLNAKMGAEAADAAIKLVRERAKESEAAVRARDAAWSTDPADRSVRGKACGGGLGVLLGVVGKEVGEEMVKLTQEERTEAALDLHGLHSNEATEVLEEFLLALEKENFFGLAFIIVGEEKHTGTQDPGRGASRARLATGIREWLHNWGYPWNERDGIICVDPLTHMQ
ncbi:uncharacterized protein FOMMEDRAFT_100748 [Fomitiporia mediterranea MF3/22]|uniref:uncharacterized protein n=1 Tax=Fomitiporia mediterranea (strain MF3/22) TaxID=694068 RepID=UPI0004407E03|nr:uncharacterized protein FOMMEDRAFT_100748 [Fomitiporia mediterranea MF3/22]EJD07486.1 hypothetical protein FOMMEDRAFT_100748 [Fomitiporia mediterranea MF3/22]